MAYSLRVSIFVFLERLKMTDYEKDYSNYILVIGVDRKQHLALPWENTCKCGCKILNKKPTEQELNKTYSCYECTY